VEWDRIIRQTDGERQKENEELERLRSLPPGEYSAAVARVSRNVDGVSFIGTPASTRRRNWALGGRSRTPKRDRFKDPVESVDIREADERNIYPAGTPRLRYEGTDAESVNAEFLRKVGRVPIGGPRSEFWQIYQIRLGQSGIYYWRREQERQNPKNRFSWMLPMLDVEKGRDPAMYTSESFKPAPLRPRVSTTTTTLLTAEPPRASISRRLVFPFTGLAAGILSSPPDPSLPVDSPPAPSDMIGSRFYGD
jgi:hypothetical protein